MIIGDRLRAVREMKNMSQGDIEKRTGLLRCYISRVENGHTVPAIETLEKMARAMEIEMYQLFFDPNHSGKAPQELKLPNRPATKLSRKDTNVMSRLGKLVAQMDDRNKALIVTIAQKMVKKP